MFTKDHHVNDTLGENNFEIYTKDNSIILLKMMKVSFLSDILKGIT